MSSPVHLFLVCFIFNFSVCPAWLTKLATRHCVFRYDEINTMTIDDGILSKLMKNVVDYIIIMLVYLFDVAAR